MSKSVLPRFSSRNFTVSGLTFRSLIHLSLLLYMVLENALVYSFICRCPVFPALLIEEIFFSPLYNLDSFVIDQLTVGVWVYFCALYSVPLIYVSVFMPIPYCVDYYSFVIQFEIRACHASMFVFLSQDCFGYLGSFMVSHKFWDCLFYFCEKCH